MKIFPDDSVSSSVKQSFLPANVSGQPGAANFSEISDEIKSAVDYIVGFRQDDMSRPRPSSIIKLEKGGVIKIIRE